MLWLLNDNIYVKQLSKLLDRVRAVLRAKNFRIRDELGETIMQTFKEKKE